MYSDFQHINIAPKGGVLNAYSAVKLNATPPTAFFVKLPFTIADLVKPYRLVAKKPYTIEKTVYLPRIDYENFVTDLCVDRWFIEQNRNLCRVDDEDVWHCILVKRSRGIDGILVMSGGRVFPYWAAYVRNA